MDEGRLPSFLLCAFSSATVNSHGLKNTTVIN
jgi:hypothetical protein